MQRSIALSRPPETFSILEKNVKRFELDEVKLFNAGIAEKRGEATLYFMPKVHCELNVLSQTIQSSNFNAMKIFTVNALATSSNWLIATAFRSTPTIFTEENCSPSL